MLPLLAEPGTEHPTPRCLTCGSDGTLRSWNLARDVAPGTGKLLLAGMNVRAAHAVWGGGSNMVCTSPEQELHMLCCGQEGVVGRKMERRCPTATHVLEGAGRGVESPTHTHTLSPYSTQR